MLIVHCIIPGGASCGPDRDAVGSILCVPADPAAGAGPDPQLRLYIPPDHPGQRGQQGPRYSILVHQTTPSYTTLVKHTGHSLHCRGA